MIKIKPNHRNHTICIIYALRNTVNDKVYVGQTWRSLKQRMSTGYEGCWHLQNAINLYGVDKFYYDTIIETSTQENADYLECYFIKQFEALNPDKGYNIREGGSNGKPSLATRQKLSAARKGRVISETTKRKISISKMGKKNPACKITAEIARQIYIDYHTNPNETCDTLAEKYELNRSNINNITKGTAWANETKDLVGTGTREKKRGKNWVKTKLNETQVREIKQKLRYAGATKEELYAFLAEEYSVSEWTISNIDYGKSWTHII
jgi:group I intron endonuclease